MIMVVRSYGFVPAPDDNITLKQNIPWFQYIDLGGYG